MNNNNTKDLLNNINNNKNHFSIIDYVVKNKTKF